MNKSKKMLSLIEDLTGQKIPIEKLILGIDLKEIFNGKGIGYSQFNELLLSLGYDRVGRFFFNFIAIDDEYKLILSKKKLTMTINSEHQLENGVKRLQKYALLLYGNIKYGFKVLSNDSNLLYNIIIQNQPETEEKYNNRNNPVLDIKKIPPEKTYYLGYLIQSEIEQRLLYDENDQEAISEDKICKEIIATGKDNNDAYLTSDYLDVYVATSMRLKHEYQFISRLTDIIFNNEILKNLNLRWFDPTQAYCDNRIDKGLVEGLMLKRAKCTIYLAQETDTLGKDSELASTLAQGKPVIAYIPQVDDSFIENYLNDLKLLYPYKTQSEIIIDQLKIFNPNLAWENENVIQCLTSSFDNNKDCLKQLLYSTIRNHYDSRATTLCEKHPLGIQVNISTGVANGVLVVRDIENCARLVKSIILQKMDFLIEKKEIDGEKYYYLREKISNCIYRVMTGNILLTNSFWNFYLQ